ncbi:MAG TPA: translocation/assembly module TamB domain-containing protein [Pseudomonadales bacterium]
MKRALIVLLGALVLALGLAAGTVVFLAATEGGTRFLAAQAERFAPVRFTGVSGALLREIRIERIELELPDQRLRVDGFEASVQMMPLLFDNHLIVDTLSADAVVLTGTAPPSDRDVPPPPLQLPYLPLDLDVSEAVVERLELPGVFPMRIAGSASWDEQGLAVQELNVISESIAGTVSGRLGTGRNPELAAQVSWSLPGQAWGGTGELDGRVEALTLRHVLRGYVSVDAAGTGSLADVSDPYVDLDVQVHDLEFGDTAIRDIGGTLRGTLLNLAAELSSRVTAPGLEPFRLDVVAYGPANGPLTLRNVTADALGGRQEAQGSVAWQDGVRVLLGGTASGVDPARLRAGMRGEIAAGFDFRYEQGRIGFGLDDIEGTLNGRSVGGAARIAQQDDGWSFEPVRLTLGRNRLEGSARLRGAAFELAAELDAPALQALALGLTGDAAGTVELAGTWPELNGRVTLASERLAGFDAELADAELQAELADGVLTGTVTAARASGRQLVLERAQLAADGPLERLDWRLDWSAGAGAGELRRQRDGIVVAVREARLELIDQTWQLRAPAEVRIAGQRVELTPACIAGGGASACVERLVIAGGRIDTRGRLERAPVALLQPWLPVRLADAGYLEGGWTLEGELANLNGELSIAARRLGYEAGGEAETLDLPDLEADGTVADGAVALRLAATGPAFSLVGHAQLEALRADAALTGTLEAAASDLSPLEVFDQRVEELRGTLSGRLSIAGTPRAPQVQGNLRLADGTLTLNDPGLTLRDIDIGVNLDDSGTFDLRGTARQDEAELLLTASGAGLFGEGLEIRAILEGQDLEARHPDWEITMSPDLNFTYETGRGWVRGRLEVPRAEVRLATLPTSVPSPSEDVVVVGRDEGGRGEENWLRTDIDVVLGDDVVLKALGITAELEGALQARRDAQGQTTLRGTLDITGGELTTQGQTLTIESGSVVYNGPVTRPYIDLRAIREIDNVTPEVVVGLRIRGDANNLTSTVFSEPAMSETRALSFLVLGRDIEEETAGDDSSRLLAAAINLGLARSRGITSELMRMTGLDELSATAEAEDSFAIVAGKRITDDIYVRYTYNTLSAVGAFLVRYELGRRWMLEAYSGEQSAMDLMYSFEK